MNSSLTSILCCPDCGTSLALDHVGNYFTLDGRLFVVDGVLACDRRHRFPILNEIPRLVPTSALAEEERLALDTLGRTKSQLTEPGVLSEQAVAEQIGFQVERNYGISSNSTRRQRQLSEASLSYTLAEYRGENKRKYVDVIGPRLPSARSILEVGSGLPGFVQQLGARYDAETAVVVDLDLGYQASFKLADRPIDLVKADCRCLPFRQRAFDLVATAFMLEHVPEWREAVAGLLRVARHAFIAFGPNRWFPYEIGHLDAPLAGTLPKPMAAYVAYLWFKVTGRGRPLEQVREMLGDVHHVSSREFRRVCRRLGGQPTNLFPDLVAAIARDRSAPPTLPRQVIRRHPILTKALSDLLVFIGMEPQMYHLVGNMEDTEATTPGLV